MIAGTLLVVLTGIFLPGILIEGQERKAVGEVQAVPAPYIVSAIPCWQRRHRKVLSLMTASS